MKPVDALRSRLSDKGTLTVQSEDGHIWEAAFAWNPGASDGDIRVLEETLGFPLPASYREFLLDSNGATLFEDPNYGQWGCVLLGIEGMLKTTSRMRGLGLTLPPHWIVFAEWLGDCDLLALDLQRARDNPKSYILDADEGYLPDTWQYLKGDFAVWLDRLIVAQGSKYWHWY